MERKKLLGMLTIAAAIASHSAAGQASSPVGCYAANPALTYSATGEPEHGDSIWASIRLSRNAIVRRPLLRSYLDHRSSWQLRGDTLRVIVSDGLAGWRLRLSRAHEGWQGVATYLSDAVVLGMPLYEHPITLTRRSCADTA